MMRKRYRGKIIKKKKKDERMINEIKLKKIIKKMIKSTDTELTECGKKMNNDGEKEQTKMMKMGREKKQKTR